MGELAPEFVPFAGSAGVTVTWPAFVFMMAFVFAAVAGVCAPAGTAGMSRHDPSMIPSATVSWEAFLGLKPIGAEIHGKVMQYRSK